MVVIVVVVARVGQVENMCGGFRITVGFKIPPLLENVFAETLYFIFYSALVIFRTSGSPSVRKTSPDHKLLRNNTRVRSFDSVGIRVKVKVHKLIIA